jgi:hypothetical protein
MNMTPEQVALLIAEVQGLRAEVQGLRGELTTLRGEFHTFRFHTRMKGESASASCSTFAL